LSRVPAAYVNYAKNEASDIAPETLRKIKDEIDAQAET